MATHLWNLHHVTYAYARKVWDQVNEEKVIDRLEQSGLSVLCYQLERVRQRGGRTFALSLGRRISYGAKLTIQGKEYNCGCLFYLLGPHLQTLFDLPYPVTDQHEALLAADWTEENRGPSNVSRFLRLLSKEPTYVPPKTIATAATLPGADSG